MNLDEVTKVKILEVWEARLRQVCPKLKEEDKYELQDHLPQFLDKVFRALKKEEHYTEIVETKKVSKIHGRERAKLKDYSIAEVLREYSILRTVIVEVLSTKETLSLEDQFIVHKLVDEAEVVAGTVFADERADLALNLTNELQRSNKELENFAAIAAHDLRSPISTIIGYIDIVQDEIENPNDLVKKSFQAIQSSSERMLLLIERLLAYAKLGHTECNNKNVNINTVISEVLTSLGVGPNKVVAEVVYKDLPTVYADPLIIHQLFQNLIANSLKFKSNETPKITILLESEDESEWKISLADNGIGFDEKEGESIFEPFKRLNNASEYQGSGLGLATVRRVIDILGGVIWAESKIGEGSKFIFTIAKKS